MDPNHGIGQRLMLIGRLANWKFKAASRHLDDDVPEGERETVLALARLFGNPGWFDGDLGLLVGRVVDDLLVKLGGTDDDRGE